MILYNQKNVLLNFFLTFLPTNYIVETLPSDEEPGEGAMVLGAMPEV